MSENKPGIDNGWVDPDDAPEWTDEMFDAAEYAIGGKVIRKAKWGTAAVPPAGSTPHISASKPKRRAKR